MFCFDVRWCFLEDRIMCRTLTLALVPALLMVTWGDAHSERFLAFNDIPGANGGTYYIGAQTLGNPTITDILGPATVVPGDNSSLLLRDRFMPELGISNVGKRGYVLPYFDGSPTTGYYGIRVFHGDNVQFWVSGDHVNWQLIPGNSFLNVFSNGYYFGDFGSNPPMAAAGGVPAVSGVGLAMMVVAMLAAGGYIIKRRQAASAA